MSNFTLTFNASVVVDGETKAVSSTGTITANDVITGKQTIGNSYESLGTNSLLNAMMVVYNPNTVDVSVQVELESYTSKRYVGMNLIAGGVMVVPRMWITDIGTNLHSRVTAVRARTDSGTAIVDYCIIK